MNIPEATPAEIDGYIAKLSTEIATQREIMDGARERIDRQRTGSMFAIPINEAELLRVIEAASLLMESIKAERSLFTDEWDRRGGWTRYFLVDSESGNGHVHYDDSHYRCSRTNTTRHYWLTEHSGADAKTVVELAGERACTVCFPWAPVAALTTPTRLFTPSDIQRQKAREAKAAAAAARDAKKITAPGSTPLRIKDGRYWETIKSVRAAEIAVVDILFWAKVYERAVTAEGQSNIELILLALAAKRGTSLGDERSALQKRYVAKCKREGVTP